MRPPPTRHPSVGIMIELVGTDACQRATLAHDAVVAMPLDEIPGLIISSPFELISTREMFRETGLMPQSEWIGNPPVSSDIRTKTENVCGPVLVSTTAGSVQISETDGSELSK